MTDTNSSGASFAPAADTSAPAASAETTAGNFGSTRGSGLARGKRQTGAAAPSETSVSTDYKPTSLEVITATSEYKNPFASPEPENAPAQEPAKVEVQPEPIAAVAEPAPYVAPEAPVAPEEPVFEKREISILPPADALRPSVSWESPSAARSSDQPAADDAGERPVFRPDRREDKPGIPRIEHGEAGGEASQRQQRDPRFARQPRDPREARQPRDPREARQPRDPRDERQPRDPREARQPRDPRDERPRYEQRPQGSASPAPAPKGFFGWLKGLFAGTKPAETPAAREGAPDNRGEGRGEGQRHRRRHRGGRGHGGGPQGFRPEGAQPQGERGENRGGDRDGGSRRRRHRGGSGRDRGGNPRSEGHQGGGAI
jgi:hypothetical protein